MKKKALGLLIELHPANKREVTQELEIRMKKRMKLYNKQYRITDGGKTMIKGKFRAIL